MFVVGNMGMIRCHAGQVEFSDLVTVMNLYANALSGEVMELIVEAPAVDGTPITLRLPSLVWVIC